MMYKIKNDTNRQRYTILGAWKSQYCENSYYTIYGFNAVSIKQPMYFSQNQNKKVRNSYGNTKDPK